jgi:undecaprenyl diphosphate synthase
MIVLFFYLAILFLVSLLMFYLFVSFYLEKWKKKETKETNETIKVDTEYPQHIAFIMDGNGRWAKEKKRERLFGHAMGTLHLSEIIQDAFRHGTQYLTFFVFAEQNWKRPKEEIENIFENIYRKLKIMNIEFELYEYRVLIQGRTDRLPKKLKRLLEKLQKKTENFQKTIIIAIDYSGRSEILRACQEMAKKKNIVDVETCFRNHLYNQGVPDPDLIIRTGGEKRISDFLLWQLCNSELYFTPVFWPDFDIFEFRKAIVDYNQRERRFGDVQGKKIQEKTK